MIGPPSENPRRNPSPGGGINRNLVNRFTIRAAREEDVDFVTGLVWSLLEFGSPLWTDREALAPGFREALSQAVLSQGPRSSVLVAEANDGALLGFVSVKIGQDPTGAHRAHVADLAVCADARRMGVGRALMRAAEHWARERELPALSLDVWSTNERAMAFYRSLGYRPEAFTLVKPVD